MQAIHHEPSTYKEAMSRPDANQWELVMIHKLKSHEENGTWIPLVVTIANQNCDLKRQNYLYMNRPEFH